MNSSRVTLAWQSHIPTNHHKTEQVAVQNTIGVYNIKYTNI